MISSCAWSLIIEILLFDPAACLYYSDEWSFTVLLVMSSRSCIQIISRSCTVTMRVTKAYRQRNENERWKANSGTRLRLRRGAWRYLPGPRVCGSRNGNRSSSILAVASEDRYTLQSVVTVGGPPARRSALYFPDESEALLARPFRSASLPETVLYSD